MNGPGFPLPAGVTKRLWAEVAVPETWIGASHDILGVLKQIKKKVVGFEIK